MCRSEVARALVASLACLAVTACVENGIEQMGTPFDYEPVPQPEAPAPEDGAIWRGSSPSASFLFFDRKARGVGDLVTVIIREEVSAEGRATTDLDRTATISNDVTSDVGFADFLSSGFRNFFELLGIGSPGQGTAPGASVNVLQANSGSTFEGEGVTTRSGRFAAIVTCRVIRVLPGNVFHIKGRRALLVNHEKQFVTVEGLVRQDDIGINNTVPSEVLAEAQLTLDGIGVIDDKQRPGWLARVMDWAYPF